MARRIGSGSDDEEETLEVSLNATRVHRAFEVFEQQRVPLVLRLDLKRHTPADMAELKTLLRRFPGTMPSEFRITGEHGKLRLLAAQDLAVACDLALMDSVEELLGKNVLQLG
jgi:hypothetical protein